MNNDFFDIDKNLVDRGWEAMRETLDEEMPQRKKKQKWAFWFWIGTFQSMIILVAVSGWYLFLKSNNDKKQVSPATNIQKPVAFAPENGNGSAPIQSASSENPYSMNRNNPTFKQYPMTSFNALQHTMSNLAYFNPFLTKSTANEPQAVSDILDNNFDTDDQSIDPLIEQSLEETTRKGISNLDLLPLFQPVFAQKDLPNIQNNAYSITTPALKKKSRFTIGFTTGIQSENIPSLTGYLVGLALDWQPYRKFGLRTSVNYQYSRIKTKLGEAPVVAVDGNTYVHFTGDTTVLGKGITGNLVTQSQDVYIPIYQQHKIDIPIMAYWQPNKHVRLYSGVSIGHVLKVTSGEYTLTKNEVHESLDAVAREAGANNLLNRLFPKWNLDYQVGFGYLVTDRFEFNVFVKNGIIKQKTANYTYDSYRSWYFNPTLESISTKHPLPVLQVTGTIKF